MLLGIAGGVQLKAKSYQCRRRRRRRRSRGMATASYKCCCSCSTAHYCKFRGIRGNSQEYQQKFGLSKQDFREDPLNNATPLATQASSVWQCKKKFKKQLLVYLSTYTFLVTKIEFPEGTCSSLGPEPFAL